ncbi:MAG: BppU family phage baseplate upper protein [Clostridium sp.]
MNIEPQKLVIDLKKRDSQSAYGIQGDVGTRQVDIYIMQGNSIFDLSGLQVLLYCITPDKSKIYIDVTITNATTGKLTVDIPQQILGLNGTTTCCLIFRQGEKQLLSYDFYIKVADSIYDEGYIQASDDFSALLKALDQVEKYDKELQDASTNLENKYTTRLTAAEKDLLFKATKEELKNVNTKVDNNTVQLDTNIQQTTQNTSNINSLINSKADKTEINRLDTELDSMENKKLDKTGILSMANMGQDVKEAMTGGSVAVVGRQMVTDVNIVDNSVTIDKLPSQFKSRTTNMIKMVDYDVVSNGNVSLNDNLLGLEWIGSNSTIIKINPITIETGKTYYIHFDSKLSTNQIQFEIRSDKIGTVKKVFYVNSGQKHISLTVEANMNVNYLRVLGADVSFNGHIWLDNNLQATTYYPYYLSNVALHEDITKLEHELNDISGDNLSYELSNILYNSGKYNLYNYKTSILGKKINSLGVISDDGNFILSDYIDIENFKNSNTHLWFKQSINGVTINNANAGYVAMYDVNKINLCTDAKQFYDLGNIPVNSFPSETKYIRICINKTYINFGVGKHGSCLYSYSTPKQFVESDIYNNDIARIDNELSLISDSIGNVVINKKCLFYGDSITAQNLFQPIIKAKLGIEYINDGNPGYPISSIFKNNSSHGFSLSSDYKLNGLIRQINENSIEYVFIKAGTNDFGYDGTKAPSETDGEYNAINIGSLDYPYDRTTYKGALSKVVDRLIRECPNLEKIFIIAPIQRGTDNASDIVKNSLGLSMYDFRNACEDVANKFSVEFIDVFNCGINFINWKRYIPDKVHPNDLGANLIANKVIEHLKKISHN